MPTLHSIELTVTSEAAAEQHVSNRRASVVCSAFIYLVADYKSNETNKNAVINIKLID